MRTSTISHNINRGGNFDGPSWKQWWKKKNRKAHALNTSKTSSLIGCRVLPVCDHHLRSPPYPLTSLPVSPFWTCGNSNFTP